LTSSSGPSFFPVLFVFCSVPSSRLIRAQILRPLCLKSDVEQSLPPKKEVYINVGMSELQKKVYKQVLVRDLDAINGQSKEKTRLLNIVMQLRKAANHPYAPRPPTHTHILNFPSFWNDKKKK